MQPNQSKTTFTDAFLNNTTIQSLRGHLFYQHCSFTSVTWDKTHFDTLNFVNCRFDDCHFDTVLMQDCNFYQCVFKNTQLHLHSQNCLLQDCIFEHSVLQGLQEHLKLLKGSMNTVDMSTAQLHHCHIYKIDFDGLLLPWDDILSTTFDACRFTHLDFQHKTLHHLTFSRCMIENSNFSHTHFIDTSFTETTLHHIDHRFCQTKLLQYTKCTLTDVNFEKIDAGTASIFMGSTLRRANFNCANLAICNFEMATLQDIDFESIDTLSFNINHAQLDTVNFKNAQLRHAEHHLAAYKNIHWDSRSQEKELTAPSEEEQALKKFQSGQY